MKFDPPKFEMSESGLDFTKALAAQFARLYETIDRLTAERDEARREVCEWEHHWDKTSSEQYYADKRGWDCYPEDSK